MCRLLISTYDIQKCAVLFSSVPGSATPGGDSGKSLVKPNARQSCWVWVSQVEHLCTSVVPVAKKLELLGLRLEDHWYL